MKIIIKGFCRRNGEEFDGLEDDSNFSEYFDEGKFPGVTGGYLKFEYDKEKKSLYTLTEYESDRKLSADEEKELIAYTQGQWSDGVGEGFEQQEFRDGVYNPSAWHVGQVATLSYDEEEHSETWTITVELTVFAGDMPKDNVISNAEELLPNLLDGTDFTGINVVDAKRDY